MRARWATRRGCGFHGPGIRRMTVGHPPTPVAMMNISAFANRIIHEYDCKGYHESFRMLVRRWAAWDHGEPIPAGSIMHFRRIFLNFIHSIHAVPLLEAASKSVGLDIRL